MALCERCGEEIALANGCDPYRPHTAMVIEQRKCLPMPRRQAPRRTGDHHHMPSPVDVFRPVEIAIAAGGPRVRISLRHNAAIVEAMRAKTERQPAAMRIQFFQQGMQRLFKLASGRALTIADVWSQAEN